MIYLIFEIIFWLFIASIFGFLIGWFVKGQFVMKEMDQRRKSFEQELKRTKEHFSETLLEMKRKVEVCERKLKERNKLVHHMEEVYTRSEPNSSKKTSTEHPVDMKTDIKSPSRNTYAQDDLKKISGIGNFLEKRLHQLGIFRFEQIASFSKEEIDSISSKIGAFPDRIVRDNWMDQARKLKNSH